MKNTTAAVVVVSRKITAAVVTSNIGVPRRGATTEQMVEHGTPNIH